MDSGNAERLAVIALKASLNSFTLWVASGSKAEAAAMREFEDEVDVQPMSSAADFKTELVGTNKRCREVDRGEDRLGDFDVAERDRGFVERIVEMGRIGTMWVHCYQ